jgi:D-alanyl-lipoteichoic acid acyltransferase DltB (MBOAT superfamily)
VIFHSFDFLIFLVVVFAVYWALPFRAQNAFLLLAGYVFYGYVHPWYLVLLAFTSTADFSSAYLMTKYPSRKRLLLIGTLLMNFSVLATYKYFNFFAENLVAILRAGGWQVSDVTVQLLLPVGLSFYTFQSASYVVDVYRGHISARRNLRDYLLFSSFFPQLVAGPIERAGDLLRQVELPRRQDINEARDALLLMAWGFLKKLVVADHVAVVANKIFALNIQAQSFPILWAGVFAFAVQIFADFSAYTDIARGAARLLGFELCQNFRHPYLADSPADFWRRWHISLSTWFRDYVYIPLGGSRCGLTRQCLALMLTFLLSGLWHGAGWNYLLWGGYHGLLLVLWRLWALAPPALQWQRIWRPFRIAITFCLVLIGWLMFRETDVHHLGALLQLSPFIATADQWWLGLYFLLLAGFIALPILIHTAAEGWASRHWVQLSDRRRWALQAALLALMTILVVFFRSTQGSDFIYFQF